MEGLPDSLPRIARPEEMVSDPLGCLRRARAEHGAIAVLREDGPLFSRAAECRGVIAVFGAEHLRAVLGDLSTFALPVSAARRLGLPASLVNLNRGLHSMAGEVHAAQRAVVGGVLRAALAADGPARPAGPALLGEAVRRWRDGATFGLLAEMRELATEVSARALFGAWEDRERLVALLHAYFHLRREVTSPGGAPGPEHLELLTALGLSLDEALRACVQHCRAGGTSPGGLVADLATARTAAGALLEEDAVVAHANVMFISATEPIAVSLTWILLLLSQRHELRRRIRVELAAGGRALLDAAIDECLRIAPPNALMVRVSTRAAPLGGVPLPAGCELVVCPYVEHRDPARFPDPDRYRPARWRTLQPSGFEYLPFGAGGHSCVGKALARHLLREVLAHLLAHHELVLAGDQEIGWRVHIMLMPAVDPQVTVRAPRSRRGRPGRLTGPVADLFGPDGPEGPEGSDGLA